MGSPYSVGTSSRSLRGERARPPKGASHRRRSLTRMPASIALRGRGVGCGTDCGTDSLDRQGVHQRRIEVACLGATLAVLRSLTVLLLLPLLRSLTALVISSMRVLLPLALLACSLAAASAALTLPAAISSHMVLQRNTGAALWGWTDQPGSNVQVTLNAATAQSVQSAKDGSWRIDLGKQAASTGNTLKISDGKETVELTDVAFGDVILCRLEAKQSNAIQAQPNATRRTKTTAPHASSSLSV